MAACNSKDTFYREFFYQKKAEAPGTLIHALEQNVRLTYNGVDVEASKTVILSKLSRISDQFKQLPVVNMTVKTEGTTVISLSKANSSEKPERKIERKIECDLAISSAGKIEKITLQDRPWTPPVPAYGIRRRGSANTLEPLLHSITEQKAAELDAERDTGSPSKSTENNKIFFGPNLSEEERKRLLEETPIV